MKTKQNIINTPAFVDSALDERAQGTKETGIFLKLCQPQEANKFQSKDCSMKLHLSIPGLMEVT